MFQVRDYTVFKPSDNAARSFRRLQLLNYAIKGMFLLLVVLCLWNIATLVQLRSIENQDLADVANIRDALSTRLIWIATLITVGLVLVREWESGVTTMGLLIPGSILLGLVLVPAMMTEIQPPLQQQTLRVVMVECPPKAIVNGQLSSMGRCDPRPIAEDGVILATSDPADGTFKTIDAASGGQNTVTYSFNGRGTYTVYFMFRFDDMDTCERSTIFRRGDGYDAGSSQCIAYNNSIWNVLPHTTASNEPSGVHLVEVTVP